MRRLLLCRILLCRSKSSNHMIQRKAMNLVCISKHVHIFMPRCACASEVYGSVFVCLCVCVDRYSCSRMNQVQVRVSIGF